MNKKTQSKKIYIGTIPNAFGYGISIAETSREKCRAALEQAWLDWSKEAGKHQRAGFPETLEQALDYFGGSIRAVILGKDYFDNFGE